MRPQRTLTHTVVIALILGTASACASVEPTTQVPQSPELPAAATPQPPPEGNSTKLQIPTQSPVSPFAQPSTIKTVSGTISGDDGSATIKSVRDWGEEPTPDDPDGDEVTYFVYASEDGGETWGLLGADLRKLSFVFDRKQFDVRKTRIVGVIAADDFHSDAAETAPFEF
ncbi:hypothetical protein SAMN06309944_0763 [Micrococcales bacterium KH10]|nr:hypothetical protein SAMN06309944_0763 [Micrococcales bacterium KH10]